jgi:hypothetical protein
MLTLAEIESTLQIEFELRLEALDEPALRQLLADAAELRRQAPYHLSLAEARGIVDATLAEMLARHTPSPAPAPEPPWPWSQLVGWLWAPLR